MRTLTRLFLLAFLFAVACSTSEEPATFALNTAASTTVTVTVASGGTIAAPTGDTLVVPPGAVDADVAITLTPFALPSDPSADVFGGAKLEPDGLVFKVAATLTLTLASQQTPGATLGVGDAPGGLSEAIQAGYLFAVDASGTHASGPIHGFSGKLVERNCHSGTREALLNAWQGVPGRSATEIAAQIGMTEDAFKSRQFDPTALQKTMGSYFEPCGTFAAGQGIDQAARQKIAAKVDAGLSVVLLLTGDGGFKKGKAGELTDVSHSVVVLRDADGRLIIRNQLNITKPTPEAGMTSNEANRILDVPFEDIDTMGIGLRDKRNSEVGRELLHDPLKNRENVPRAWSTVAAFCEKPRNGPTCKNEDLPNGSCGGNDLVCIGTVQPCTDPMGAGCCPKDMCNYFGACVQIKCPTDVGRNYDCKCCCTSGSGEAGSCADSATKFNVRDACNSARLCSCSDKPTEAAATCGGG